MAKKRDKSKVANGVAKAKKDPKNEEGIEDREDLGEDADAEPAKKVAKKRVERKKTTKKPAASSSSAEPSRVGGRARKATDRYTEPAAAASGSPKKRGGSGNQWPVQAIRGIQKTAGNKFEYLVKWQGYKETQNNWEPEANVRNCGEHIKKFVEDIVAHTNTLD